MNANEISQLAKTFSTACKVAVEKSKVKFYSMPVLLAVIGTLLSLTDPDKSSWAKKS